MKNSDSGPDHVQNEFVCSRQQQTETAIEWRRRLLAEAQLLLAEHEILMQQLRAEYPYAPVSRPASRRSPKQDPE